MPVEGDHLRQSKSVRLSAPCAISYPNHLNVLPPQSRLANVVVVNLVRVIPCFILSFLLQYKYSQPVLTATSEQQLPASNRQPKPGQIIFNNNFDWKSSKQWPPMYNCYYFGVPMLAVEGRFDCTYLHGFEKDQPHKVFPWKIFKENNVYQMKGWHRFISLTMLQPGMVYSRGSQPWRLNTEMQLIQIIKLNWK